MNILEKNTIIAEFMDDSGKFNKKRNRAGCVETLHYHNDWLFLMPVVEKLETLPGSLNLILDKASCRIVYDNGCKTYDMTYHGKRISTTYDSIVGFLEWYKTKAYF